MGHVVTYLSQYVTGDSKVRPETLYSDNEGLNLVLIAATDFSKNRQ